MRNCPNCNNGVEESATKCPHCGVELYFKVKVEQPEPKAQTQKKKKSPIEEWHLLLLLIVIVLIFTINTSANSPSSSGISASYPSLTEMGKIKYGFKKIPENISDYLKISESFSPYYNAGKKFAIYFTGADCPYAQMFDSAIAPIVSSPDYQQAYNFMSIDVGQGVRTFTNMKEAQADIEFNRLCEEFCIVNPSKSEIFSINGVGEEEAARLSYIFDNLKDW